MVASPSQQLDPWADIEEAAVQAFGAHINPKAPRLIAVIRRSVRYAQIDRSAGEIVIDRRAFFLGLIAVGIGETPSRSRGNTATWFAFWLRTKFKLDVTRVASLEGLTGTDKLLDGFPRRVSSGRFEICEIKSAGIDTIIPIASDLNAAIALFR